MEEIKEDVKQYINSEDDDIPSFVKSFVPTKTARVKSIVKEEAHKVLARKSSFFITFNPNLGKKILGDEKQRITQYRKLKTTVEAIGEQFKKGLLIKKKPSKDQTYTKPKVEKYEFEIELANIAGLHAHIVVIFDGTTYIDLEQLREFITTHGYTKKPHLNVKFSQMNSLEVLKAYNSKQAGLIQKNEEPNSQQLTTATTINSKVGRGIPSAFISS
jgi:hypothetical protein